MQNNQKNSNKYTYREVPCSICLGATMYRPGDKRFFTEKYWMHQLPALTSQGVLVLKMPASEGRVDEKLRGKKKNVIPCYLEVHATGLDTVSLT